MATFVDQRFDGDGPEAIFRRHLADGKFYIQKCANCGAHIYVPRVACNHCQGIDLDWVEASGKGSVYSTSVVRVRPDQGGDYNVAIVELAEGPRLLTRVEAAGPEEVKIGMPVQARIAEGKDDLRFIVFDPA